MKIDRLTTKLDSGIYYVTYRYWRGNCACTAKRITRAFGYQPSDTDLKNAVNVKDNYK